MKTIRRLSTVVQTLRYAAVPSQRASELNEMKLYGRPDPNYWLIGFPAAYGSLSRDEVRTQDQGGGRPTTGRVKVSGVGSLWYVPRRL